MKNSIRSIHEANLGKRLVAMIMDGAIFVFVTIALALWVFKPIVNSTMHYDDLGVQGLRYQVFSKLWVCEAENADGEKQIVDILDIPGSSGNFTYNDMSHIETDNLDFYKDRLHYYYCSYLTGENLEVIDGHDVSEFRSPEYNIYIKDNSGNDVLPKDYYTDAWFSEFIKDANDTKSLQKLARSTIDEFSNKPYYKELNNQIKKCQLVMFLPPIYISYLSFYLLVPLLFKNGETFGKKVMKIGFATKDCYFVKKRQIVFRQILLMLWVSLFLFVLGIGLTSIATLGVGVVIYLVATAISKTKRSPVDYAAYTYLIDTNKSVWFKDAEEEEKKSEEVEIKMSKYRRFEPENKHVIQIGSEIVDEDIKKEIEEEKLKEDKK